MEGNDEGSGDKPGERGPGIVLVNDSDSSSSSSGVSSSDSSEANDVDRIDEGADNVPGEDLEPVEELENASLLHPKRSAYIHEFAYPVGVVEDADFDGHESDFEMQDEYTPVSKAEEKVVDVSLDSLPNFRKTHKPISGIVFDKFPWAVCIFCLAVIIFCTLTSFAYRTPDLGSQGVFSPRDDDIVRKANLVKALENSDKFADVVKFDQQSEASFYLELYLETPDGQQIFQKKYLDIIKSMHDNIMDYPAFGEYCWIVTPGKGCQPPMSPVNDFYPNGVLVANLTAVLAEYANDFDSYSYFYDNTFRSTYLKSDITRLRFMFGLPLKGYHSPGTGDVFAGTADDLKQEQAEIFVEWAEDLKKDHLLEWRDHDDLTFAYFIPQLLNDEVRSMIIHDLSFGIFSFLTVVVIMYFQLYSIMLTVLGLFHVLAAWPIAYFIYVFIFQRDVFPMLNQMALFVMIGIGADDIFVVVDAWKQSWLEGPEVLQSSAHQINYVLFRAFKTMAVTTATTFAAFVSTAFNPIPVTAAFGLFAASIVAANFALVVTWYIGVVVIWSRFFEFRRWGKKLPKIVISPEQRAEMLKADPNEEFDVSDYRIIERFFYSYWAPLIRKTRFLILLIFVFIFIAGCVGTSFMGPYDEEPSQFPDNSNFGIVLRLMLNEFAQSPDAWSTQVYVIFGVKKPYLEEEGIDPNDENKVGDVVFDSSFELHTPACQQHVLDMCNDLAAKNHGLVLGTNATVFWPSFHRWWTVESPNAKANNASWPIVPETYFNHVLRDYRMTPSFITYFQEQMGTKDDKPEWIKILFNATAPLDATPEQNREWFDKWENLVNEWNQKAPTGCNNAVQGSETWIWMRSSELFVQVAIQSIIISVCIAWLILNCSTWNPILACYATSTIVICLVTVLSLMVLFGWKLSTVESICVTILVGISVDYVVHYANTYREGRATKRWPRTRNALLAMGVSVTGSALTTILACVYLFFTYFLFFKRFGQFILLTIAIAYIYANTYFVALLMTFGPNGNFGSFFFYGKWLLKHCCCCLAWNGYKKYARIDKDLNEEAAKQKEENKKKTGNGERDLKVPGSDIELEDAISVDFDDDDETESSSSSSSSDTASSLSSRDGDEKK